MLRNYLWIIKDMPFDDRFKSGHEFFNKIFVKIRNYSADSFHVVAKELKVEFLFEQL